MAMVNRNGRTYVYRSVREGSRVTSRYVGAGPAFALLAELDSMEREESEREGSERRAERERLDAEDRAVAAWFDEVQAIADGALLAAGFHRHKRQGRKRRAARPA